MNKIIICGFLRAKEEQNEIEALADSINLETVFHVYQSRDKVDAKYFLGKGKIEEIKELVDNYEIDIVLVDDELSGSHLRNITEVLNVLVIDRTMLLLDIFAKRSSNKLSDAQIELAQLDYLKTRLVGVGKELSQQGAGIGTRGPGETKLETDRRKIDIRIKELKRKIDKMLKSRELHNKARKKRNELIVSLVGYTNAGKSTLMNAIIDLYDSKGTKVFQKDMLFASLDTSVRKIYINKFFNITLIDTVGFVNRLPKNLITSFYSTFREIDSSDLILHVFDSTDKFLDSKIKATKDFLVNFDISEDKIINVANKSDIKSDFIFESPYINVSAKNKVNIDLLMEEVFEKLNPVINEEIYFFSYNDISTLSEMEKKAEIISREFLKDKVIIKARVDKKSKEKYKEYHENNFK